MTAEIGIIGGSGLYKIDEIRGLEEKRLRTPFGEPSDAYMVGELSGRRVAFLARHGRGHRLAPSEINFRANIYGMKMLGVERIVSAGAVGSMKEEIHPTDLVFPDQFIDRTVGRVSTFFGDGLVAHVAFADPVCAGLRAALVAASRQVGVTVHDGGTYLNMEGPQFSTRAESRLYRQWGVHVIGMTNLQEAKLAREAEICYATLAMATDYDCWREGHEDVSVEAVVATMQKNAANARAVIRAALGHLPSRCPTGCQTALRHAIMTAPETIGPDARARLGLLIDRPLAAPAAH